MTGDGPQRTVIEGGRVVTPDGVRSNDAVIVEDGRIARVGDPDGTTDRTVDAGGQYVMPGFVDLHGDDVERFLSPRSGERIDPTAALVTADDLAVSAGVTTKFDAVAFEDAPAKGRSPARARSLVDDIAAADCLAADHRVHARCELTDPAAVAAVEDAVESVPVDLVSLLSHVPGEGQFEDEDAFARRYADGDGASESVERLGERRSAVGREARRTRTERLLDGLDDVVVASHDDGDPAHVDRRAGRGVDLCEFPVTMAAAQRAHERGLATAMGAPNLVRGGSLWDNLSARAAVSAGLVDALCSDYRPRSLLESVFVDDGTSLSDRVERVTAAPARIAGLDDRGELRPGARADLIVVDPDPVPSVTRAFVAGRTVHRRRVPDIEHTDG